jgi:diguanylate cyclase (GGDEF)-like protein
LAAPIFAMTAVLTASCRLATAQLRPTDSFGRIGGEESAMLPDTDKQDAVRLAERLRTAFAANVHAVDGRAVTATVSVGFACSDGADSERF